MSPSRRSLSLPLALTLLAAGSTPARSLHSATYELIFEATWNANSHPVDFPNNPHFSGLIGGVHSPDRRFWQEGALATAGMEAMAERGSKSPLREEVEAAIAAGLASAVVSGGGIDRSPGSVAVTFTATREHSALTLVSMLAPSPDWFVGVDSLELYRDGDWVSELEVTLYGYDAGTDSGATYKAANADTRPPQPIRRLDSALIPRDLPLGRFVVRRTDASEPPVLELGQGRFRLHVHWRDLQGSTGFGQPQPLTEDTGYFWFFEPENVELLVKVLDACADFDRFWVFAGGLTNVEVTLAVEDTTSGDLRVYENPQGSPFLPVQDVGAFATCP